MIKFQCDTCGYETDSYHKSKNNSEYIPLGWITLSDVTIYNEHHSCSLSYAGKATMHFCSKKCFVDKFFKPEETIKPVENTFVSSCC